MLDEKEAGPLGLGGWEDLAERIQYIAAREAEVGQRWNERLVPDQIVFPKDYLDGRFNVVLKLQIGSPLPSNNVLYAAYECVVGELGAADTSGETSLSKRNDEKVVFVPVREIVEGGEGLISRVSHVAVSVYLVGKQNLDLREGLTYQRISDGSYEAIPVRSYRKRKFLVWSHGDASSKPHPSEVQGGPQISDNVASQKVDVWWDWFGQSDLENLARATRIKLYGDGIGFSFDEILAGRVKIDEVYCGPFNL